MTAAGRRRDSRSRGPRRPRVLLIRQEPAGAGVTGCAPLPADGEMSDPADWSMARADAEMMGVIYRGLRTRLGDSAEIVVVDPRNTTWLVPALMRAARQGGATWSGAARTAAAAIRTFAIVVDDEVVVKGPPTSTDDAIEQVAAAVAAHAAGSEQ